MAGKIYRVRAEHRALAVLHPESGNHVVANATGTYPASDPLVRTYPWMFISDDEIVQADAPVETVSLDPSTQMVRRGPGRPRKSA